MGTITINGVTYQGRNVVVRNGEVIVDGKRVQETEVTTLVIEGDVHSVESDLSVSCRNVTGGVLAGGSVSANNVGESVRAGGSINCHDVGGGVVAGGSVNISGTFKK